MSRLYLRMLISVPGNRIQEMLSYGDERVEEVNAPQYTNVSSLLHSPSAAGSQPRQPLLLVSIISLYYCYVIVLNIFVLQR
jgi:hypothetical protein